MPPVVPPLGLSALLVRSHFQRIFMLQIFGSTHDFDLPVWYIYFVILSQWVWFIMSTRNFFGSGQNSPHPLLGERWIACLAITWGSCIFNTRVHASLCKPNRT